MSGVVIMTKSELRVYNLAREVILGKLSLVEFSMLIKKSYRQSQRIVKKVKEKDYVGVLHGNTGKKPINKTSKFLEEEVLRLLRTKYYDFNLTHFREQIKNNERIEIGKNVLHRLAKKRGLVKNPKRRRKKVHHPRPRMPREGMLVQFDGSEHQWFGNFVCDLIAAIDDATGKILCAEFFIGETSLHSMKVISDLIHDYGVPEAFYTDGAAMFGKVDRDWESQIGRALEQVGSNIIIAGSAQAKGRVERLFGTLQDRLIAELRLNNIKSIPAANKFLKETFIPNFNNKFAVQPRESRMAYKPQKVIDYNIIFCKKEKRKVATGNTFNWKGKLWFINEDQNYRFRSININTHLDGSNSFDIMGKKVIVTIAEQKSNKKAA